MNVGRMMSGAVVTASPTASVRTVAKMMDERRVGSVVVTEGDRIVGIVTDRDILRTVANDAKFDMDRNPIEGIMTRKVHYIGYEAEVDKAVDVMLKYRIKKLPVVRDGKVVGIITSSDVASSQSDIVNKFRKFLFEVQKRRMDEPEFVKW